MSDIPEFGVYKGMMTSHEESLKMSKVKHNEENIEKLAQEITDSAELETIVQHFYEDQYEYYKNDREAFETDWDDVIGDEDE